MLVTIYTDASYKDKKGSWAVYLVSDKGKITASGKIDYADTNNIAEFIAIRESIKLAKLNWEGLISKIVVRTDSMMCCHMLWDHIKGGSKNKHMKEIKKEILQLTNDIELEVKHIERDKNAINKKCDREAKTMRTHKHNID